MNYIIEKLGVFYLEDTPKSLVKKIDMVFTEIHANPSNEDDLDSRADIPTPYFRNKH